MRASCSQDRCKEVQGGINNCREAYAVWACVLKQPHALSIVEIGNGGILQALVCEVEGDQ